jgi:hypothetical protein
MKIYFTTMYGDISIEVSAENKENVFLKTTELSTNEKAIVKDILKEYDIFPENGLDNQEFVLEKRKIEDVHKLMKKLLKKDRPTMTAIKYKDGKIECVEEIKNNEEAETGVTVEKPHKGCPMPSVIEGEVRASIVLKEFLSEKQMIDFERYRQFVSIGGYSNKPYLLTSRWCDKVVKVGQLYDVVEKRVICANCMELLPSEEMLSLKLMLEFKEREFLGMSIR